MKKWDICLRDVTEYEIEAETKEEAVEIALDYWVERLPEILWCDEIKEEVS